MDGDHPTPHAGGAGLTQRADAARDAEPGSPATSAGRDDRHRHPGRADHRPGRKIDAEPILAEPSARCGRDLGVDHGRESVLLEPGQVGAGVGAVAVDHRPGGRLALARDQVAQQGGRDHGVPGGGRADLGRADDLAVGVDGYVALL
jgi:hypothetical protein